MACEYPVSFPYFTRLDVRLPHLHFTCDFSFRLTYLQSSIDFSLNISSDIVCKPQFRALFVRV